MGAKIGVTAGDNWSYRPEPKGTAKDALVVCQEIFGANHRIRALFDRARQGVEISYTADTSSPTADHEQGRSRRPDEGCHPTIDNAKPPGRVGVGDRCWGGTVDWATATRLDGLAAPVGCGGVGIGGPAGEPPRRPGAFRRPGPADPDGSYRQSRFGSHRGRLSCHPPCPGQKGALNGCRPS
jgi:carboxymethylenebutenolidase